MLNVVSGNQRCLQFMEIKRCTSALTAVATNTYVRLNRAKEKIMSKRLATYLAIIIISDLMKHTTRDFSSYEYELLEARLMQGKFEEVEGYIRKYL